MSVTGSAAARTGATVPAARRTVRDGVPAHAELRGVRPRPDYVRASQTTLPRWEAAGLRDQRGTSRWLVYLSGAPARDVFSSLGRYDVVAVEEFVSSADACDAVKRDLSRATAGTRVLAIGPELFVAHVGACARMLGAIDDEIALQPTDVAGSATEDQAIANESVRLRRLYCVGCSEVLVADFAIGDVVACPLCQTRLVAHYLYSHELAAVLGQHHEWAWGEGQAPP